MTVTNNIKSRWTEEWNRKMANYTEHDDATIKIIGVKQGPRKMSIVHVMCVCYQLFNSIWTIQSKPTGKQSIKSSDYHYLYWTGIWQCLKPHAESPSLRFCGYGSTPFIFLVRSAVAILHTRVQIGFDLVAIGSLHWMMTNPTAVLLWQGRWEPEPLPWSCQTSLHGSCQS